MYESGKLCESRDCRGIAECHEQHQQCQVNSDEVQQGRIKVQ